MLLPCLVIDLKSVLNTQNAPNVLSNSHAPFLIMHYLLYSGKVCQHKVWQIFSFRAFDKKAWRINRSTRRLLIVDTNLDGYSLMNHRQFTKFSPAKLSCYTVGLYFYTNLWTLANHVSLLRYMIDRKNVCCYTRQFIYLKPEVSHIQF